MTDLDEAYKMADEWKIVYYKLSEEHRKLKSDHEEACRHIQDSNLIVASLCERIRKYEAADRSKTL